MKTTKETFSISQGQFHLGETVCALYQGRYKSFVIKDITSSASGDRFYSGEGSDGWHAEDRLDYDLTQEQKDLVLRSEHLLWELDAATADVNKHWQKMQAANLPPSILAKFRREVKDSIQV